MSQDVSGIISWLRQWFDDIYALKGSGGNISLSDVYPIGSIYMSVNNTSPQSLFGGTWVQLQDTFLYATSTTADANSTTATDGEATHSLTESEMPRHTHIQMEHNHTQNPHHHDSNRNWSTGTGSNPAYAQTSNRSYQSIQTKDTTATNKATTATNKYTGGSGTAESASNGVAHNNMPPYMKVYMWKRTA